MRSVGGSRGYLFHGPGAAFLAGRYSPPLGTHPLPLAGLGVLLPPGGSDVGAHLAVRTAEIGSVGRHAPVRRPSHLLTFESCPLRATQRRAATTVIASDEPLRAWLRKWAAKHPRWDRGPHDRWRLVVCMTAQGRRRWRGRAASSTGHRDSCSVEIVGAAPPEYTSRDHVDP